MDLFTQSYKKKFFFLVLIIVELLLFSLAIILAIQILNISQTKVKGVQNIVVIKKRDLEFSTDSGNLKYFYEPKPNNIIEDKANWLQYEVKHTINNDGLNERYDYDLQKRDNYRIITLGDSFTYGQYVNTAENYPETLEDLLNNKIQCKNKNTKHYEVLNLGVPGYDVEYSVERFIKRGIKYNPDLIVWLINDWNFHNINEYIIPLREKLEREGIPSFDEASRTYLATNVALQELDNKLGRQELINYSKKALLKFINYYNNKLLIVVFPTMNNVKKKIIQDLLRFNPNFYYTEISSVWDNEDYLLYDKHPNKEGHKKIAEDIFNYLRQNMFSNCHAISN